jgi:hypothetical protein
MIQKTFEDRQSPQGGDEADLLERYRAFGILGSAMNMRSFMFLSTFLLHSL